MLIRRQFIFAGVLVLAMLLLTVAGALAADPEEYYVKTDGDNDDDGLTQATAWHTITYALTQAHTPGDVINVQAGTYSPSLTGEAFPLSIGCSHDGITLLGAGIGKTILNAEGSESNKRRVLTIAGVKDSCTVDDFTLEGFTIKGGYVNCDEFDYATANGGGIYCYRSQGLTIRLCEICDNYARGSWAAADGRGAGINWSTVRSGDSVPDYTPARAGGGGIYLRSCKKHGTEPTVTIEQCLIHHNETGMGGGGICCNYAPPLIQYCCIVENKACKGGGVYWFDYILECDDQIRHILFNVLIAKNLIVTPAYTKGYHLSDGDAESVERIGVTRGWYTSEQGGGLYMSNWGLHPQYRIYSTTVADNGGYEVFAGGKCQNATIKGANDIFWPDNGEYGDKLGFHDDGYGGVCDFSYSDIWWKNGEEYPGIGTSHNLFGDPLFECYGDGTVIRQCYFLQRTSPAVDTGFKDATTYTPDIYTPYWFTTDTAGVRDGFVGNNALDMGFHHMRYGVCYIDLESFTAHADTDEIVLNWETGTEIDNAGFVVYRTVAGAKDYGLISGLIPAQGDAASGASYAFVDEDVESGVSYEYWLVDIDTSGKWTAHGPAFARLPVSLKSIQLPTANSQLLTAR